MKIQNHIFWILERLLKKDKYYPKIMKTLIHSLVLIISIQLLNAQHVEVTGVVKDSKTQKSLSFASISVVGTTKGTISNEDGYFSLILHDSLSDFICTYVGYKKQIIKYKSGKLLYEIQMEPSEQMLKEVTILANDSDKLYELVAMIKKNKPANNSVAKGYFESKSYCDTQQVELVTAFYNIHSRGYEITDLQLKAGKVGYQKFGSRIFMNIEASKSITGMEIFNRHEGFPENPMLMRIGELKKKYVLDQTEIFLTETGDTIVGVEFTPKNPNENLFSGKLWVNSSNARLIKIKLYCRNCMTHPFTPLTPSDQLTNVNMEINRSFHATATNYYVDHADFTFIAQFSSRHSSQNNYKYPIHSRAILHSFDTTSIYIIPKFEFPDSSISDYSKIFSFPYIPEFWESQKPYQIRDQFQRNENFYSNPKTILNGAGFHPSMSKKEKIFTTPYTHWSEKRTLLNTDKKIPTSTHKIDQQLPGEKYHLEVQIFLDVNKHNDSTMITTRTIIDPYATFFNFPSDSLSNCFINLYFDLCESERRKFEKSIINNQFTQAEIDIRFNKFKSELADIQNRFLNETDRGTNYGALYKWNEYIFQQTGIDNMRIFNVARK